MSKRKKKKTVRKKEQSFEISLKISGITHSNCNNVIREYKEYSERLLKLEVEMTWEEKQEEIEETLRHYGISDEEISEQGFWYYKTKEPFKQIYGINELERISESKKFRAIIDYDADWEHYIIRILSHGTQEGNPE